MGVASILVCEPDIQRQVEPDGHVLEAKEPDSEVNHCQVTPTSLAVLVEQSMEKGLEIGLDEVQPNLPDTRQINVALTVENRAFRKLVGTIDRTRPFPKPISDGDAGERIADQGRVSAFNSRNEK